MFNWFLKLLDESRQHEFNMLKTRQEHEIELQAIENDSHICQSCETLKAQLEFQNQLIRELTHRETVTPEQTARTDFKPISSSHKPWSVRRAELETADRKRAQELTAEKNKPITADDLEAELESIQNA